MYLPPLQPVSNKDVYINGDVTIHPTATLAPGVVLQAGPNSRIVIGAEVSLGMGTILNASQGEIEIANGATLGAGVLIIGASSIGSNACIGTATTIFNSSVEPMAVIAPGSLIGDNSRAYDLSEVQDNHHELPNTTIPSSPNKDKQQNEFKPEVKADSQPIPETTEVNSTKTNSKSVEPEITETQKVKVTEEKNNSQSDRKANSVVGKVYINQLLLTLFPHYQSLDSNSSQSKPK